MKTRAGSKNTNSSHSIATRLRHRDLHSETHRQTRSSIPSALQSRPTRRSAARAPKTYADSDSDNDDDDDVELSGSNEGSDAGASSGSEGIDFRPRQRVSKRPHSDTRNDANSRSRRKLPRRAANPYGGRHGEGEAYLSLSSDSVLRSRMAALPAIGKRLAKKKDGRSTKPKAKRGMERVSASRSTEKDLPTSDTTTASLPPWSTLPYLVLTRVFGFAAAPLDNIASVRWLVAASQTCRAFAEPALRALYESPPLLTLNMVHTLLDLLSQPSSETMFDYRHKVKELDIEVGSLASRVYRGRHFDIAKTVAHCPRLTNLTLHHYKDQRPYRQLSENLRWTYPPELFEALGAITSENPDGTLSRVTRLESWQWNQRLMGRDMTLDSIRDLHLSMSFAGLRKVGFINYQRPSLSAKNADSPEVVAEDRQQAEAFAELLAALPKLTHLVMESSTAANEFLLPLLPKTLQCLELINCWDVTALSFSEYLVTDGQQLRHLVLHHNQSLSLGFLPVLGEACPNLRSLRMNLTYYNHHAFYNDSNPLYDSLLLDSQVPSWPPKIEVIELENLRKWEPSAAEVFFQSLVDSAPKIPMLRTLAIKAMLNIPWKQRIEMRDRWGAVLTQVFKRRVTLPEPAYSLGYYDSKTGSGPSTPKRKQRCKDADLTPPRRSYRIAVHESESSSRYSSTSRGLRKSRGLFSYREPDSDEDIDIEGEEDDDNRVHTDSQEDNWDGEDPAETPKSGGTSNQVPVHGMCDVVDIIIDNQKPGEIQYRMEDFLDSENLTSDDEWTGDGVETNEYAW